eukprot:TRINITY_DN3777_c0_g1_i4.p2 TRINITY_DN3777_c0_g1~~TRINITY_DN3777_c0_g1_i4.p2  ORF type:complete len:102 (+),score=3.35 TRINITY_DN3777_c0_g1_i4:162-467(+)
MGLGLYSLLESVLLIINALAILNENRFLKRVGLYSSGEEPAFGDDKRSGVKTKIASTLSAVRLLLRCMSDFVIDTRCIHLFTLVPLIFINSIAIVLLILFG